MNAAILTQPVVIDNGTGTIKCGLAGGDRPSCVYANCVGRPKHVRMMPGGALEGAEVRQEVKPCFLIRCMPTH